MAVEYPAFQPIKPFAVSIRVAQKLLGDKARSVVYDEIGRGRLEAIKDGGKTLIVLESIERYMASLPEAKIKRSPSPTAAAKGEVASV